MRTWKAEIHARSGSGSKSCAITSFKTYSLTDVAIVLKKQRSAERAAGLPKQKLRPITTHLLEDMIQMYFREYAIKGEQLEKIVVED